MPSTKTIALLCFGLAWGAMIVASSSTVIFAHDFIHMMAKYVLPTDGSVTAFQIFWGSCWFAVVKGWHMTEFAVICMILIAILHRVIPKLGQKNIGLALFATTLFAINDEYRQTFVEGRGGTWSDVGFDVFGASIVAWFCLGRKATVDRKEQVVDPVGPSTV
ncbi:VanZ family protein [Lacunimicrobium album]